MEPFDQETAARVWQRVHREPPLTLTAEALPELIHRARLDAATYLQLSRRFQGQERMALQLMFRQKRSHAACLKGIYRLLTGKTPEQESLKIPPEPTDIALRRCYGSGMHSLADYERFSADLQYGPAFSRLARQEQAHCHALLELIGKLSGK